MPSATKRARLIAVFLTAFLVVITGALPASRALAQGADDNLQSGDSCQKGNNLDKFKFSVNEGPPGSMFIIQGKPHNPKTVGPGSDVALNWREKHETNFTANVAQNGTFTTVISVPADFAPGPHTLMYAEASPYTSCLEFNVTQAQPGAAPQPAIPGMGWLAGVFLLFARLISLT